MRFRAAWFGVIVGWLLLLPGVAYAACPEIPEIARTGADGSPFATKNVTRMETQTSDNVRITGGCIDGPKIINGTFYARGYGNCTWDATHDVSSCINAALVAAGAVGGGYVILPPGTYGLLNTVTFDNTIPSVILVGQGGAGAGRCGTTLKWLGNGSAGTAGGTVVKFGVSAQSVGLYRNGLVDMCIDGNSLAAKTVEQWSLSYGKFERLYLTNATSQGWLVDHSTGPAFPASASNLWIDVSIDNAVTDADGLVFGNSNNSDAILNTWIGGLIKHKNGIGFKCMAADSNTFINLFTQVFGTGKGVQLGGSDAVGTIACFGNTFYSPAVGDGSHANSGFHAMTGSVSNARQNTIYAMKTGDGERTPTDNTPGGGITVHDDNGWSNIRMRQRDVASNVSVATVESNTLFTTTGGSSGETAFLPAATGSRIHFCFLHTDQSWVVEPDGTDTITVGGTTGTAGGGIQSQSAGSQLCVADYAAGSWTADRMTGSWSF